MITPAQSATLGVVEGLTEFLPVSSTGHLILAAKALGLDLDDPGVSGFLIAIQAGAILAVLSLYRRHVALMLRGLRGDREGLHLLFLIMWGCLPALVMGAAFGSMIMSALFSPVPVAIDLALGGVAMIVLPRLIRKQEPESTADPDEPFRPLALSTRSAFLIGLAQCIALLPGMSRSMVTILSGMGLGMSARQAAEFSFLLALPILTAATAKDVFDNGQHMVNAAGYSTLALGFIVAWAVAALSIKFLIAALNRFGLAPFGVYRLILAVAVLLFWTG